MHINTERYSAYYRDVGYYYTGSSLANNKNTALFFNKSNYILPTINLGIYIGIYH
jgi:hypothetical protein